MQWCRLNDTCLRHLQRLSISPLSPQFIQLSRNMQHHPSHIDCIQLYSELCKFASLHLMMQNLATFPAIEEHASLSFAALCFYAVLLSYNVFPAWHAYMFVYIYNIYALCFPCLQDWARLKIAHNILAHIPKRLWDPDVNDENLCKKKHQPHLKDLRMSSAARETVHQHD